MSVPGTNNLTKAEETPRDLVQYIVVRGDLNEWGTGALMAQAVHAGIAAVWDARTEEDVAEYCSRRGDNAGIHPQMRTVLLKAETESALLAQVNYLKEVGVRHVLWTEMPEGIPTALAARPYPVDVVKPHFKKFRLFK